MHSFVTWQFFFRTHLCELSIKAWFHLYRNKNDNKMSEEKTAVYNCTDTDTEAASGYGKFFQLDQACLMPLPGKFLYPYLYKWYLALSIKLSTKQVPHRIA